MFGDSFTVVAIPFAVFSAGGDARKIAIVLAAETLPLALLLPIGGTLADRLDRRQVVLGMELARGIVLTVMALALLAGADLWHLIVGFGVYGAAGAFLYPALTALVPETVIDDQLPSANAVLGFSSTAAAVGGPVVAGALIGVTDPTVALAVDALTFFVAASVLASIPSGKRTAPDESIGSQLSAGWKVVRTRLWFVAMVLHWGTVLMLAVAPTQVLGPAYAERELGGAAAWGLVETGLGIGGLLGRIWSARLCPNRPLVTCALLTTVAGLTPLAIALHAPFVFLLIARFMMGMGMALYGTLWVTTLQRKIPSEHLGRVSAYDWFGSIVFMPIGFAVAGWLVEVGGGTPIAMMAVVWASLSPLILLGMSAIRNEIYEVSPGSFAAQEGPGSGEAL